MGISTFVYALVLVSMSHNRHGVPDGITKEHIAPDRAWLEVQDWGTPWTRYFDIEQDTLLAYARCFYFGEG